MKKGWLLAGAMTLFLVGFWALKWVVGKRPHLFARIDCWEVITFSPDGKKLLVCRNFDEGEVVDVATKARTRIRVQPFDTDFLFSPDNQVLFQLQTSGYEGFIDDQGTDFRVPCKADPVLYTYSIPDGQELEHFPLLPPNDFYGVCQKGKEIIAQSRLRTWRFDGHTGKVLSVQKQSRSLRDMTLAPDGQTLFRSDPKGVSFFDLQSQQRLWRWNALENEFIASGEPHFSNDGQLVLVKQNGVLVARDTRTGAEQWRLHGLPIEDDISTPFALSPDGKSVYEGRPNREMWIWPVR